MTPGFKPVTTFPVYFQEKPDSYQSAMALVTSPGLEPSTLLQACYTLGLWSLCGSSNEPISLFAF